MLHFALGFLSGNPDSATLLAEDFLLEDLEKLTAFFVSLDPNRGRLRSKHLVGGGGG